MLSRTRTIADLRQRAEARLGYPTSRGLLHRELELHKLELELQNEDLKRTHDELEAARDRYRELFDAAPVAYLTLDGNARICAANRAACQLTGLSSEQLLGVRLAALLRIEDADRLQAYLANLPAHGANQLALDLLRPDGTGCRVLLEASRTREGVLGILHEQRAADAVVHEARQLAALGASTSTIAHEVNNLLHVIGASLAEIAGKLDEPSALASVRNGQVTLGHCKEMVSRLLVHGLPETPSRREIVVDEVVERAIAMLRPLLGESIRIRTELGAPTTRTAFDPVELELVLINLASNAHDAMPDGGQLTIATRVLSSRGQRSLVLVVEDTGHGMSAEDQGRVFEPFFTTKHDGNGLGLATTRAIIERAHGTIAVKSTPEIGTTFEITLPLATEHRFAIGTGAGPHRRLEERESAQRTILVVEDNGTTRLAMHEHLQAIGYRVILADSHDAALEAARTQQIDLALLDYRLRSTSGELLARQLRELHPELRVLLTSGYPRQCINTIEHFLQKPFSLDELTQAVARALEAM